MFDLFSDIMACRPNALTKADSRVKLVTALALLLAALFSTKLVLPVSVLIACLITMAALRLPARLTLARLLPPLLLTSILAVMQAFLRGSTPLWSFSLCGFHFTATVEGAWLGALLGARVLAAVSVLLLLSAVTPAHQIFHALRWLGMPKGWVELALLMYRYIFVLLDEAADVATAQRVRLGYATWTRSLSSLGTLSGTVVVRSLDQSVRTHEAMTLRGYTGNIPFGRLPPLSRVNCTMLCCVPVLLAALYCGVEYARPQPKPPAAPERRAP
jgi:cobalt/nickel transport system permease protein